MVVDALTRSPTVARMAEGMRPNVTFTTAEFAAAAVSGAADPRFSFDRLKKNARWVRPFIAYVQSHQAELLANALREATAFLDVNVSPDDIPVRLVCGGAWDAYALIFERTELYFDVGFQADGPLDEVLPDFQAILAHETFHLAYLAHQKRHWPRDVRHSQRPAELFLYEMSNEGIGHYYSMSRKLFPKPTIADFAQKERHAFELLRERYLAWRDNPDEAKRSDELWHSHAGVPFWDKWGAVPGGLVAYRLVLEGGNESVARLLAREPFSLFIAYDEKCATHPEWPRLPEALVRDARAARDGT